MVEEAPPASGGGASLSKKMGPMPMWAWIAGSTLGGVVFLLWWQNRSSGQESETAPGTPNNFYVPGQDQNEIDEGRYQALLAMIRDLQGKPSTEPGDPDPETPTEEAAALLPAPTGFKQNDARQWPDSVQLGWNNVTGNTGYVIKEVSNNAFPGPIDIPANQSSHQIKGLVHNGSYHFTIAAKNKDGKPGATAYTVAHTKN